MGDVPRCVYCGWTKDAALRKIAEAGKIQKETFRSGGTLWPFVASALILTGLAGLVAWASWKEGAPRGEELVIALVTIGSFLFLGPVLCAVQIARRNLIWIHVDPEKGLEMPRRGVVAWTRILSIDRYPGAFEYKNTLEQLAGQMPQGLVVAYKYGCLIVFALLIYTVFLPVIVVLSPWGDRVTLVLDNGERVVLRDLEDSDRFTRMVRYKIG
ncbi:MAG TPA: hypothetical protein VF950_15950 [Planctomycetota bacterium]